MSDSISWRRSGSKWSRSTHDERTFLAEVSYFLDCVDGTVERPITDAREEREPLLAVAAAYRSMESGLPVRLARIDR